MNFFLNLQCKLTDGYLFIMDVYSFAHHGIFQWDDSYIYLIMEYCHGGDLSKFIRQRRALAEISVKRFLQQLGKIIS